MIVKIPFYMLRMYSRLYTDRSIDPSKLIRIRLSTLYDLGEDAYDHKSNPRFNFRFETERVPVFGRDVSKRRSLEPDFRPVAVIAPASFKFASEQSERPAALPVATRIAHVRPSRSASAPSGTTMYLRPDMPGPGQRPEYHRVRRDKKVSGLYRRILRFVNRTYGRYSELAEIADAFHFNHDVPQIATALAINEAIDYAYGRRARFLREKIYSQDWYRLPVGIDFIKNRF